MLFSYVGKGALPDIIAWTLRPSWLLLDLFLDLIEPLGVDLRLPDRLPRLAPSLGDVNGEPRCEEAACELFVFERLAITELARFVLSLICFDGLKVLCLLSLLTSADYYLFIAFLWT